MIDQDRPKFAAMLATLAEIYERTVTQQVAEIYFTALKDFSIDDVKMAVEHAVKTNRFFPRPAELLETMRSHRAEHRRALAEQGRRLALVEHQVSEAERQGFLEQIRAFTAKLVGAMRPPRGVPTRPVSELESEVARLRAADRADQATNARKADELNRMRQAGLL